MKNEPNKASISSPKPQINPIIINTIKQLRETVFGFVCEVCLEQSGYYEGDYKREYEVNAKALETKLEEMALIIGDIAKIEIMNDYFYND